MTLQMIIRRKHRPSIGWITLKFFTKTILLYLQNLTILHFLKIVDILQLDHHQVLLIKKIKQDIISMQPSNCYIVMLFFDKS